MVFSWGPADPDGILQAYAWWHTTWDTVEAKAFQNLQGWDLLPQNRRSIDAMVGWGHPAKVTPHASNRYTAELVVRHSLLTLLEHRAEFGRTYYLVTFIDEAWNTYDREPVLNVRGMKRKVSRVLNRLGLNGLGYCELQIVTNQPDKETGKGDLITPHVHMIVWATEGHIDAKTLAAELSVSFKGNFGAPGVDIRPVRNTEIDLARACAYMAKAPYCAKFLKPTKAGPRLRETTKGYRGNKCLRILELLSHHTIQEMTFGCGVEGAKLRATVFKRVRDEEKRLRPSYLGDFFDPSKFWATVRERNGKDAYQPPVIIRKQQQ